MKKKLLLTAILCASIMSYSNKHDQIEKGIDTLYESQKHDISIMLDKLYRLDKRRSNLQKKYDESSEKLLELRHTYYEFMDLSEKYLNIENELDKWYEQLDNLEKEKNALTENKYKEKKEIIMNNINVLDDKLNGDNPERKRLSDLEAENIGDIFESKTKENKKLKRKLSTAKNNYFSFLNEDKNKSLIYAQQIKLNKDNIFEIELNREQIELNRKQIDINKEHINTIDTQLDEFLNHEVNNEQDIKENKEAIANNNKLITKNSEAIFRNTITLNDYKKFNDARVDKAFNGISAAVAMANLPTVGTNSAYSNNLSAAYGYFGGAHSIAIGLSGITPNERVTYKVSTAFNTHGDIAVGIGLGVNFGQKRQTNKELMNRIEKLEKLVEKLSE